MNSRSLVSVVIPTFNAAEYLGDAIRSVFGQTYRDWELLIIDDGSTDATPELIASFCEDPRVYSTRIPNAGVANARNVGVSQARGQYVAFLDADDTWEPRNLEAKVALLDQIPEVAWIYSDAYLANEKLERTAIRVGQEGDLLEQILLWEGDVIPGPGSNLLIRRSCFDAGLRWDPHVSSAADQDLTLQLAKGFRAQRLPEPMWTYRVRENSMSRSAEVTERDHLYVYRKATRENLFPTAAFRQRCFSNLYLIIAGTWWGNAKKLRALLFVLMAVTTYPPNLLRLVKKALARL